MSTQKKKLIGLAIVVAIAVAGGYAAYDIWHRRESTPSDIVLYGNIDIREADLAFNVTSRLDSMLVEEGDAVQDGQLLATLDAGIFQAEVKAAEARVAARRAVLDRLLSGSRPEEIKEARANVRSIEADLENARGILRRTEKLAEDNFAAREKVDEARARVRSLEAQADAAGQRLSLVIQGPRKEDIADARAQLKADEAEAALARRRLAYTELRAKGHGVVKTRILEPGAVVLAQDPVYTIALSDPVWVRAYVSEPNLGRIKPGMKAVIETDSAPGKDYEGWVGFISPVAEFTPKTVETREVRTSLVYRLRIYVKNPKNELRQGMPVTVRLRVESDQREADKPGS